MVGRIPAPRANAAQVAGGKVLEPTPSPTGRQVWFLSRALAVIGAAASFTMGANDVSNATGVLTMTHLFNVWAAGLVGGLGLFYLYESSLSGGHGGSRVSARA